VKISWISGNITGIQKEIFPGKALPFIIGMEQHVLQTGVAAVSCRTVFFMNSFIITVITPRGIDKATLNTNEVRAGDDPRLMSR
jgi:hypothetical protein